jgi:hypothetical protein
MSLKITDDNYQTYKKIYEILCKHRFKEMREFLTPDVDPIRILESCETKSKSIAKRGLKAGLTDSLSRLSESPKAVIDDINSDLQKENLPNVHKLIAIIRDTIKKVLQTKRIRTLNQYYIVKEFLDDTTSDISDQERQDLSKYFGEYEIRATTR